MFVNKNSQSLLLLFPCRNKTNNLTCWAQDDIRDVICKNTLTCFWNVLEYILRW